MFLIATSNGNLQVWPTLLQALLDSCNLESPAQTTIKTSITSLRFDLHSKP